MHYLVLTLFTFASNWNAFLIISHFGIINFLSLLLQVLRFSAFFKESCVESGLESYRVRKVLIYFYLEDNSIEIIEPKQMNSGIPQGSFLKR